MSANARRGVNWTVLAVGLAVTVPLIALFAASFGNDPRAVPNGLVGGPSPAFRLVDLDGASVDSDALRGKPVVLNFWSTWCGPCKQEHGALQEAARQHPEVAFYGVLYNDEPEKARRYLDVAGTSYKHLVDDDGRAAIDFGVAGVPETYFIDAKGTIVHKQVGPLDGRSLEVLLARAGGR
jgi:cytochrome c biogenesis protein CcmG/thiol:disulfide interchange protein DsbE